jgi:hypothetical protein
MVLSEWVWREGAGSFYLSFALCLMSTKAEKTGQRFSQNFYFIPFYNIVFIDKYVFCS